MLRTIALFPGSHLKEQRETGNEASSFEHSKLKTVHTVVFLNAAVGMVTVSLSLHRLRKVDNQFEVVDGRLQPEHECE